MCTVFLFSQTVGPISSCEDCLALDILGSVCALTEPAYSHMKCMLFPSPLFFSLFQIKKQTKKEKELEKQKKEKELCKLEAALMDPSRQPQSADDFDRLVLSSPNSSILWLQYMAFHLQATEIEKARAVAERALKTICFR